MSDLDPLLDKDGVDEIVDYQTPFATKSIILNRKMAQAIRVFYLQNLREDWEWVDGYWNELYETGHVLLKRKN